MKVLYVSTIANILKHMVSFSQEMLSEGHIIEIATNIKKSNVPSLFLEHQCLCHQIDFERTPFSLSNISAFKQLAKLANNNSYDIVHCHTPVAAVCARFVFNKYRKKGTKVIYTAHGFHFYKGAPLKNWLLFYPIEWVSSFFTDVLITINSEDYCLSIKHLRAKCNKFINGVGINIKKYEEAIGDRTELLRQLDIPQNSILLLSVGELNKNKNQQIIIAALKALAKRGLTNYYFLLAGTGNQQTILNEYAQSLGVNNKIRFLGYRSDCDMLYKSVDLFVLPSYREGLPVSMLEAICAGVPCIGSNIRGVRDLLPSTNLFNPNDEEDVVNKIINHNNIVFDKRYGNDQIIQILKQTYFEY